MFFRPSSAFLSAFYTVCSFKACFFWSPPPVCLSACYLRSFPFLATSAVTWLSEHIPSSSLSVCVWGKRAGTAACLPACLQTRWPGACLRCRGFTAECPRGCGYSWPWDTVNTVTLSTSPYRWRNVAYRAARCTAAQRERQRATVMSNKRAKWDFPRTR